MLDLKNMQNKCMSRMFNAHTRPLLFFILNLIVLLILYDTF